MADKNAIYGWAEYGLAEWAVGTTTASSAQLILVGFSGGMNDDLLMSGGMNG